MKLLIYSHFFAPSIGGVESIVLSLAQGLSALQAPDGEKQFDVTVVTQTPAGNFDDRLLSFPVVRQPSLIELWRLIRASDVVHAAGPALAPLLLAQLARKVVVVEHHGYQAICPNGVLVYQPTQSMCPGHFQAGRYRECLRCQNCTMPPAKSLASLIISFPRLWLTRRASMNLAVTHHVLERQALPQSRVVYHGIADPVGESQSRPIVPILGEKICFAYVGRLVPEKGIEILLQAAQELVSEGQQFEVRLIGDGPERPGLEAIIARDRLGNCVRITGFLTGQAFTDALRDVRVVVMPSIWEETAGLAAIEQMMRGRLVIASDVGGLGEVVGDAGLRCAPGDAKALAECMRKVLRKRVLIDSYGEKARERALQLFALGRMIEEHAEVYRETTREMPPASAST